MGTSRKVAIIAGVLFITAWVSGALSQALSKPVLDAPDYLIKVSANVNQVSIGALLEFIMAAACAGIAISMYPVLRKFNTGLALGSVAFRTMEGAIYMVGVRNLLSLLTLSQQFKEAGAPGASWFQTLGDSLLAAHDQGSVVGMLAFSLGALMYYYIFYQSKLIPRWLSGWGLVGAIPAIAASMFVMLRLISPFSTIQIVSYLPIGLQEIVLGVWLIAKGFNPSAIASGSAKTAMSERSLSTSMVGEPT